MKESLLEGCRAAQVYDFLYGISLMSRRRTVENYIQAQDKLKKGMMHRTLRYVLTGKESAPPNSQIMDIIGWKETKKRIQNVMDMVDDDYDFKQLYAL